MACPNQVGVKNIVITFRDCDTDVVYSKIAHKLSSDELPTWRLCSYSNEVLPGGYVKRTVASEEVELKVIRDLRVPIALYQGCASVDLQVEYFNGLVYSAKNGSGTGDEKSDTHEVTLTLAFREIDELLPNGALLAA